MTKVVDLRDLGPVGYTGASLKEAMTFSLHEFLKSIFVKKQVNSVSKFLIIFWETTKMI